MKTTGYILGPFGYASQQPDGTWVSRVIGKVYGDTLFTGPGLYETLELVLPDTPQPDPPHPDPPIPPALGVDQLDLSQVVITESSPDVREWPKTAIISSLSLSAASDMTILFNRMFGEKAWPFLAGSEEGEIQYTLWVGCNIGGKWYFAGVILGICRSESDNYLPTGPALRSSQLPVNWYYYTNEPLASYQPAPGEKVAFMVTSGVQRRNDLHVVAERSNVVLVPFQEGFFVF